MDTRVQSPGQLFQLTQTLVIPLFQRPYVWSEERQWIPLWEDVERLVELRMNQAPSSTHFLGAVVMQQSRGQMGFAAEYSLIDELSPAMEACRLRPPNLEATPRCREPRRVV